MDDSMNSFLNDGLGVYAKARATLALFEVEIGKLISASVQHRERWSSLRIGKTSQPTRDKGFEPDGYWMYIKIEALSHRQEQVVIECGIWWNATVNCNAIIYGCFHQPGRIMAFPWKKEQSGIESFNRWNKTHLYLPVEKNTEIDGVLNQILDQLLIQLDKGGG